MFDYIMWTYGGEVIAVIVTSIFGILGVIVKQMVKKYLDDETKRKIAKAVVQFVEQCYKQLHGEEKLNAALTRMSDLLAEKGIEVSVLEMETLIEAAVAEFNEAFKKVD